jgi:hypothetical protein
MTEILLLFQADYNLTAHSCLISILRRNESKLALFKPGVIQPKSKLPNTSVLCMYNLRGRALCLPIIYS